MNKPICEKIDDVSKVENEITQWLEDRAKEHHLNYLLAHADDGVVWGRFKQDGILITQTEPQDLLSKYKFAELRWSTLQQCRIFSEQAEVLLWKVNEQPKARLINDRNLSKDNYICETQILWGTHGKKDEKNKFTLLWDGKQGLRHAVPFTDIELETEGKLKNRVGLEVRHYLDYDDSGVARIYLSRLVDLKGS
ncbi:MAG: CRISPR-associated protein Csx19 [Jaaginema sp. PMC 1079.18]|nr:CRISPR-associated protein Csx19 [Jaaginema sp. PMC 1080.18]MEC4853055.1 CRISPR-associated protein Csx19 [Jaaginema sp. PMC 1079.18]MEC4866754.1 CRISPR-associated protein Csx19 [Jaaginema sp. PMC 1078.18]